MKMLSDSGNGLSVENKLSNNSKMTSMQKEVVFFCLGGLH